MGTQVNDAQLVGLSVRGYRLLLTAYPSRFRSEYGPHMLQVFRDCSIRDYERNGSSGILRLWAFTLFDLTRSLVEEHLQKETFVTRNTLIRISGWAMAIGGLATSTGFITFVLSDIAGRAVIRLSGTLEDVFVAAFFLGPIGVAVGLLGLRARYGDTVGSLGTATLAIGALGGVGVLIGDVLQVMEINDEGFTAFAIGLVLIFACMELFGILALRRKPIPRWNGLPILAGLPISAIAFLAALGPVLSLPLGSTLPVPWVWVGALVIMGGSLVLLGYMVQSDLSEEASAEPVSA
jgi:hypothetical protein